MNREEKEFRIKIGLTRNFLVSSVLSSFSGIEEVPKEFPAMIKRDIVAASA